MSLKKLIDVSTLSQLLKKNIINKEGVRLLDCSFVVGDKPDWKMFKKELYGNFKEILSRPSMSKDLYLSAHIPEAVHASMDAAMYPSQYERFALYPPEIFEKFIQSYGHEKSSVLDGRFALWRRKDLKLVLKTYSFRLNVEGQR
ncbi:hypothetical protein OSTOST_24124 [Ostertagia ostertagi]